MHGKYNNAYENPSPFIHSEKEEEDPRKISHNSNGSPDARNITGTTMVSNRKKKIMEKLILSAPHHQHEHRVKIVKKILTDSEDYENNPFKDSCPCAVS